MNYWVPVPAHIYQWTISHIVMAAPRSGQYTVRYMQLVHDAVSISIQFPVQL